MRIETLRRIDRFIGAPLCRLLSILPARRERRGPPSTILVVLLSEMGSLVLADPLFDRLKRKYPQARICALVSQNNGQVLATLDAVPDADVYTLRTHSLAAFLKDSVAVVRRLRRLDLDVVIDCELFSRVSAILSRLSGAGLRVGFHRHRQEGLYRGDFINRPVLYNPYQHIARQFLALVEAIESSAVPPVKRRLAEERLALRPLSLNAGELDAMRHRLEQDFPQVRTATLVLLYAGGGLIPVRAWPLSSFQELAVRLVEAGLLVGVIGLDGDKPLASAIQDRVRRERAIDLTGYTRNVREVMVLFHLAELLITNDGGPGHFAAKTPIRSVILYGPETPVLYGSLDPHSVCLFNGLSCSPCLSAYNHRNSPCDGDNQCLKTISVDEVFEKAMSLLPK
ncbi:MAG TPA: glycosyltransferase family 9 protein [Vicinamibacteria bacterium]|nr:glycosyltransferase family 9 protein [Vicinamibacteria bacterium]